MNNLLQAPDASRVFVAGDVAAARVDPEHWAVMSCQRARPMGRLAGRHAVADLFGEPMMP